MYKIEVKTEKKGHMSFGWSNPDGYSASLTELTISYLSVAKEIVIVVPAEMAEPSPSSKMMEYLRQFPGFKGIRKEKTKKIKGQ